MSDLLVRGGVDLAGRPVEIAVAAGVVADAAPGAPALDASGLVVAPGLLDLQVNGAGGVDVTREPHRIDEVGQVMAAYGVTAFLPTVITCSPADRARALAAIRTVSPTAAVPLGLHLEGPFLAPGHRGAHPEQWLEPPSVEGIRGWSREDGVAMATLAPELPGALEVIEALVARGVVVSLGHTGATVGQAEAAVAAGARCVTHLFNAMPPVRAREPGPAGLALGAAPDLDLVAGVIADGHHLDPHTLRTAWRALGPGRFVAVSDTTAALGMPDGPVRLGDQDVTLADGAVRLPDGTLAGSGSSLVDCLRVLREVTGCSLADALATATTVPARLLGDATRGRLERGCRGDLVLLEPGSLAVVATVVGGRVVHDVRGGG